MPTIEPIRPIAEIKRQVEEMLRYSFWGWIRGGVLHFGARQCVAIEVDVTYNLEPDSSAGEKRPEYGFDIFFGYHPGLENFDSPLSELLANEGCDSDSSTLNADVDIEVGIWGLTGSENAWLGGAIAGYTWKLFDTA